MSKNKISQYGRQILVTRHCTYTCLARVFFAALLIASSILFSQTYNNELRTLDYVKLLPLAQMGDPINQAMLGMCYENGIGVAKDENLAFKWYFKAAEQTNSLGQAYLGRCYEKGIGVAKDEKKAVTWYIRSAEQGCSVGQVYLGELYSKGVGVPANPEMAFKYFQMSAEQGNSEAQYSIGSCYQLGSGVSRNEKNAFEWFEKSANQGNKNAQRNLGFFWLNGIACYKTPSLAFHWFQKAAEQGEPQAQVYTGYCYGNGVGVSQDKDEAFKWYKKAADQDNALGQVNVGICYSSGQGINKNSEEAIKYFTEAANKSNPIGMLLLGQMYQSGTGITKDVVKGFELIRKAQEAGSADACYFLGTCYLNGKGTAKDLSKGIYYINKAALSGLIKAQLLLGDCYLTGVGVKNNYSEALRWYRAGSEKGDIKAMYKLARALWVKPKNGGQDLYTDAKEASEILNKISNEQPKAGDHELNYIIGCAAMEIGDFIRAKEAFQASGLFSAHAQTIEPAKMRLLQVPETWSSWSAEILDEKENTIGSGVFYGEDGWVITAAHVVSGGKACKVRDFIMRTWDIEGVFAGDYSADIAILKTSALQHPSVNKIGPEPNYLEEVYAAGHPNGTLRVVLSRGDLIEKEFLADVPKIQMPCMPGQSGAPVFNKANELVSIVTHGSLFTAKREEYQKSESSIVSNSCLRKIINSAKKEQCFSPLNETKDWKYKSPFWDYDMQEATHEFNNALIILNGYFPDGDKDEAMRVLEKVANKGVTSAQVKLAMSNNSRGASKWMPELYKEKPFYNDWFNAMLFRRVSKVVLWSICALSVLFTLINLIRGLNILYIKALSKEMRILSTIISTVLRLFAIIVFGFILVVTEKRNDLTISFCLFFLYFAYITNIYINIFQKYAEQGSRVAALFILLLIIFVVSAMLNKYGSGQFSENIYVKAVYPAVFVIILIISLVCFWTNKAKKMHEKYQCIKKYVPVQIYFAFALLVIPFLYYTFPNVLQNIRVSPLVSLYIVFALFGLVVVPHILFLVGLKKGIRSLFKHHITLLLCYCAFMLFLLYGSYVGSATVFQKSERIAVFLLLISSLLLSVHGILKYSKANNLSQII